MLEIVSLSVDTNTLGYHALSSDTLQFEIIKLCTKLRSNSASGRRSLHTSNGSMEQEKHVQVTLPDNQVGHDDDGDDDDDKNDEEAKSQY